MLVGTSTSLNKRWAKLGGVCHFDVKMFKMMAHHTILNGKKISANVAPIKAYIRRIVVDGVDQRNKPWAFINFVLILFKTFWIVEAFSNAVLMWVEMFVSLETTWRMDCLLLDVRYVAMVVERGLKCCNNPVRSTGCNNCGCC